MPSPENKARENIDQLLTKAGWTVRDQRDATFGCHKLPVKAVRIGK